MRAPAQPWATHPPHVVDTYAGSASRPVFGGPPRCITEGAIADAMDAMGAEMNVAADIHVALTAVEAAIRMRVEYMFVQTTGRIRRALYMAMIERDWEDQAQLFQAVFILPRSIPVDDRVFTLFKGKDSTLGSQAVVFNLQEIRIWLDRRLEELEIKE